MGLSVGIGLTNDCNLNCAHCYRPTDRIDRLTLEDVELICRTLPVGAIGLGTGENALHPQFLAIVGYLRDQNIPLSLASNGYSLNTMPEEYLRAFHDVEVSIDFPTSQEQDAFRGQGNWRDIHAAMNRCQRLGLPVSILATLMNTNYERMDDLARLAQARAVNLRVNAYQPVRNDRFTLSYAQFWEGYRRLFGSARLVSCTEPVVRAALGLDSVRSPCGHESIRVTPKRNVAPCVYWPEASLTIDDLVRLGEGILLTPQFRSATQVPPVASDCRCQGGCASRRALLGELNRHDMYCPWVRGDDLHLGFQSAEPKDLVRSRNYCTTIVT